MKIRCFILVLTFITCSKHQHLLIIDLWKLRKLLANNWHAIVAGRMIVNGAQPVDVIAILNDSGLIIFELRAEYLRPTMVLHQKLWM